MSLIPSTLISFLSIGSILLLLFAVFRFMYREKYAESILKSLLKAPEANRERFLNYEKKTIMLLKISLWPAFLLLIALPLGMFLFFRDYFLVTTVGMVLFLIIILQEYGFRKWLINYLEAKDILK